MTEMIHLTGVNNARDLGGMKMKDGRVIRKNRLIRSGMLANAAEEDQKILLGHDLRTVVDMRTPKEKAESEDADIPNVQNVFLPILSDSAMGITRAEEDDLNMADFFSAFIECPENAVKFMAGLYRKLTEPGALAQYRKFFDILLNQEEGAVLWHCTVGKDRAGTASLLVEFVLGADYETLLEDYLLTNLSVEKSIQDAVLFSSEDFEPVYRAVLGAKKEYVEELFRSAEERYGSMENMIYGELGLTEEKVEKLRDMYLE